MHGRTANKELDPGRYLRWLRAAHGGLALCALDLPGHGERTNPDLQESHNTLAVVGQAAREIDAILSALAQPRWNSAFDLSRVAIGGMSAGGIATLIRLAQPHTFRCAAVEATAANFALLPAARNYPPALVAELDPMNHIASMRPIPILALHSAADQWVPVECIATFIDALRAHYASLGADPGLITLHTWPHTGAPNEHYGFGKVSNEAKNLQTDFLTRWLNDAA